MNGTAEVGAELVATARRLATHHHAGQVDKAGQPYIGHIERVADRVSHLEPEVVAAAWLHDIVEDTAVTEADLAAAGIPAVVIEAVVLLTKTGGPLDAYYARIRENPLALAVKLADIADNADPDRQVQLAPEVRERLTRKYAKAVAALT
jgi:(p)ppGpp synthase/HD superfamily hydrolase